MEELLLGTLFSDDELDIVDEQDIIVAVFFTKFRGGGIVLIPDGVNQLIGKGFRGELKNFRIRGVF